MDSSSHETVELYMNALKEMVIYHNELLPSGKFDNNQLLRFNSIAIKLLKGYSNGVIPRLPQLPYIQPKQMNIIKTIKSWFAPKPEMSTADALEAKIASIKARKEAENARANELLKAKTAENKEAARLSEGTRQLNQTAKEYVAAVAKTRRIEADLAKAKEARVQAEIDAENVLIIIDDVIDTMILELDVPEPTREPVKSRVKTTIPTPTPQVELEDFWAEDEEEEVKTIIPSVVKQQEETKKEEVTSPKTGRARKAKTENKGGTKTRKRPSVSELSVAQVTKQKGGKTEETPYEPKDPGEEGALVAAADIITAIDSFDD